jgi:Ion channel.
MGRALSPNLATPMLSKLLLAWGLMALCVVIHASGVTFPMRWVRRHAARSQQFWVWTWLLIRLAGWMILLHLIEIFVWALFYAWQGAMPDIQSAFYFSSVTYTTTGYGDLVLPEEWRVLGGVEALTGILMCGLSTGFFFAVVSRMLESRTRSADPTE